MELLLVCSSGGHLQELLMLREYWLKYSRVWVTFNTEDSETLLKNERVISSYFPTNRSIKNLVKNLYLASKVFRNSKPTLVVSTGAGIAVPFMFIAKIFGAKTVYIESITRINELSLTGRILYYIVDYFIVQWPELVSKYRHAVYKGSIV